MTRVNVSGRRTASFMVKNFTCAADRDDTDCSGTDSVAMSISSIDTLLPALDSGNPTDVLGSVPHVRQSAQALEWFAIWTRSRHEARVVSQLERKHIEAFLPTITRWSRWKDRKKRIDWPLF